MPEILTFLSLPQLMTFLSAGIVLNLIPGSDVLTATAFGIKAGPRAGAASGFGTGLGSLFHIALAALGVAALIAAHPLALDVIRWAGAGYLVWLGWKSFTATPGPDATEVGRSDRLLPVIAKGALTNILNPKPILFILAFLPQFITPEGPPAALQILALGLLFCTTGTLVTMAYGLLAGLAGRSIGRRMGLLNRIAGLMFGALALRLATSG
ncbi:LysE family translocator [Falsigemmobacter faecalis]|uniref:LysE family translocator n=1 Tax=Falsigemmobacter faecalis TaxID=2488730 RepID=A0A3P3DI60_9RHOB|nr:LysE family translocator [Falsigemmobacter faecalis]RRH73903.1 LysE family translocator [Falsigemmobacter faecalis]